MKRVITIQHCQSEQHVNGMMGGWNDWELTGLGLSPEVMNSCGIFGKAGAVGEFGIYRGWEHRILRTGDISYIRD